MIYGDVFSFVYRLSRLKFSREDKSVLARWVTIFSLPIQVGLAFINDCSKEIFMKLKKKKKKKFILSRCFDICSLYGVFFSSFIVQSFSLEDKSIVFARWVTILTLPTRVGFAFINDYSDKIFSIRLKIKFASSRYFKILW